jgi:2-(1,2-epoxy-1,2-dihydrophenyl)acetyl-CoA isomerase
MSSSPVLLEFEDGVATVTLSRPELLNALDPATARELAATLERCASDAAARAVVLTGAGRAFCAGGDMKAAYRHIQSGDAPRAYFETLVPALNRAVLALRAMEKPALAAINGDTSGAGLSLAAACDLRLMARSARLKPAFGSIGQVPGGGWSLTVPRLIGAAKAFELLYSSELLDAQAALGLGLVSEVVDDAALGPTVHERALALARGPAQAFAGAKALVNAAAFAELAVHLEREQERILIQASSEEFRAALLAFIEKRRPAFGPAMIEPRA